MAVPNEVYALLKEFDKEYGSHWERIPETDGNEHVYASVTLARIATRLPRKTIYKALKIGKEWRYA